MNRAALSAASPCIGICRLHAETRVCVGCGRTGDEIAGWREADEAQRQAIVGSLPARLATMDTVAPANPETPQGIRATLRDHLQRPGTAVVAGCHGAVAEFMAPPDEAVRLADCGATLTTGVTGGALRLEIADGLMLFGGNGNHEETPAPLLIAGPHADRAFPIANGLTPLGVDAAPICAGEEATLSEARSADVGGHALLFDLGVGHAETRFILRTADPVVITRLNALEGAPLGRLLAEAGPMLLEASPDRVVETPLCRIEVTTPIPAPGGQSPVAPHTHLLPGALALGRLLPPGIACPAGFVPVALLYRRDPL